MSPQFVSIDDFEPKAIPEDDPQCHRQQSSEDPERTDNPGKAASQKSLNALEDPGFSEFRFLTIPSLTGIRAVHPAVSCGIEPRIALKRRSSRPQRYASTDGRR